MFALVFLAIVNDGSLTYTGSIELLSEHPNITLVDERIHVRLIRNQAHVSCDFTLRNGGPTCTIRVGFPDVGEGSDSHIWEVERYRLVKEGKRVPPYSGLKSFSSSIDGQRVATTLIPKEDLAFSWHVKNVTFRAGQTRKIRETYVGHLGAVATSSRGYISQFRYLLNTGASWKGRIGSATIVVDFAKSNLRGSLQVAARQASEAYSYERWRALTTGTVIYSRFARPTISGKVLTFRRANFEPTERDDLDLFFNWRTSY